MALNSRNNLFNAPLPGKQHPMQERVVTVAGHRRRSWPSQEEEEEEGGWGEHERGAAGASRLLGGASSMTNHFSVLLHGRKEGR